MIYEFPDSTVPIRQGDIFSGLPRVDISLREVPVIGENNEQTVMSWEEIAVKRESITAVVGLKPVVAIVVTQDCDTLHGHDITLCEIREFRDVERKSQDTSTPKAWMSIITQQARFNQKWFYLPPDSRLGFTGKMGVDFMITLRVPRGELEDLRHLRRGRLNPTADEHFRERLSEYFRRYPYDEWYPLNPEELKAYMNDHPDAKPFPWQETQST
jgi:hypothetical protein